MQTPKLIIFDCDGVLIDSEIVVCQIVAEELTRLGYVVSTEQVIERYAGRPEREMVAEIEADWSRPIPAEYFDRFKVRLADAYKTELRAVPGVPEVVRRITMPVCVASSSWPEKLKLGLQTAGLHDRFAPNLISASWVQHGKPAPDVFIYAAGWMRTPITQCIVIEDSVPGTRAARAAGMRVFGFTGGSHCPPGHADRLREAGADTVMKHMNELESLLPEAFGPSSNDRPAATHRSPPQAPRFAAASAD